MPQLRMLHLVRRGPLRTRCTRGVGHGRIHSSGQPFCRHGQTMPCLQESCGYDLEELRQQELMQLHASSPADWDLFEEFKPHRD